MMRRCRRKIRCETTWTKRRLNPMIQTPMTGRGMRKRAHLSQQKKKNGQMMADLFFLHAFGAACVAEFTDQFA
ncbi:Hypothetical protein, putative [Bodo saltans]|uniref:Uncharacterized protein n=1 Tax=Bodo saltans TaxID=75058 RepID=A0A0S4JAK4_BODSA|nr:Hypothetical protein, putative [Bodo saltans]|eukprot:CUG86969.1 Hypothetical protein, putative [Bodo saltans]